MGVTKEKQMSTFPNVHVLNRTFANNARIAPDSTSNNTVTEKKNFSIAHPQRLNATVLNDLLGQFDLNNLSKSTNGVLKGNTSCEEGKFHMTAGVIKFTGSCGPVDDYTPPTYNNPVPPVDYNPTPDPVTPDYNSAPVYGKNPKSAYHAAPTGEQPALIIGEEEGLLSRNLIA
jgi:hypothetical protein